MTEGNLQEVERLRARIRELESELTRQSGLTQHCPLCEGWAKKLEEAEATLADRNREIESLRDLLEAERAALAEEKSIREELSKRLADSRGEAFGLSSALAERDRELASLRGDVVWTPFDEKLGSQQKMPARYRTVLVYVESIGPGMPKALSVGYRKDAAGDKESPYFVVPGHGGKVLAWCDCLPASEKYKTHRDGFTNYWQMAGDSLLRPEPKPESKEKP